MTNAPILLIHYGDSPYLPYVIKVAKRFNPRREIIFLGDEHNEYVTSLGALHYKLASLRNSHELDYFNRVYHRIVNPRYPKSKWAKFVLERWYMINTFIAMHKIDQFWTFDSDNFILTDLTPYQEHLSRYDCTSQCSGNCMNGFISSRAIVQRYVNTMNALLSDEDHIKRWHLKYEKDPTLFYNEMEAFKNFVQQEQIRNFHLAQIHNGAMFDDSITYGNGMELYEKTIKSRYVKKLYLRDGQIYCRHLASGAFIRMNSLNLSWMPKYIFPLLFDCIVSMRSPRSFIQLDLLRAPLSYHIKLFIRNKIPRPIRDHIAQGAYWV
jgi:hypothetical protein